jgi:hypothetical protein
MELVYYPVQKNAYGYKLPSPDSVIGTDLRDLGEDKELYRYNFMRKQHHDLDDNRALINLARSFSLDSPELDQVTSRLMDMDEWARAYALISLCQVSDVYTFSYTMHNVRFLLRPDDGKFLLVPHDLDHDFVIGANAPLIGTAPAGVTLSRVLQLPANLRRVYGHFLDLVSSAGSPAYMQEWVAHYNSLVPDQDFSTVIPSLEERSIFVRDEIAREEGEATFDVLNATFLQSSSNVVALTGTAPILVQSLLVNGREYPVTWRSLTNWFVLVPVSEQINELTVQALDLRGNLLPDVVRTRTVVYAGSVADPEGKVIFSEIMPAAAPERAFVELFNRDSGQAFDLSGWRVEELGFTFPSGSWIASGQRLVLAASQTGYLATYGIYGNLPYAQFTNSLPVNRSTLTLLRPSASGEAVVDRVYYENAAPWPDRADSAVSLQLVDPGQDNSRVANWAAAVSTPGGSNTTSGALAAFPPLWVNEVQPENQLGRQDFAGECDPWVEVFNASTVTQSLAGLFLSDNYTNLTQWAFPESASIPPGGFLVVWCDGQSEQSTAEELHTNFRLAPGSGSVALNRQAADPQVVSYLNYAGLAADWSYGSVPDGQPFFLQSMSNTTPGESNNISAPIPTVFINEWMALNTSVLRDPVDNNFSDWFELYNPGPRPADLGGCSLTDDVEYPDHFRIPDNGHYVIPPGGYLLVWANARPELNSTSCADLFVNFELSREEDAIALYSREGVLIDSVSFGMQSENVSQGRFPSGAAPREFMRPSPGAPNELSAPITLGSMSLGSYGEVRLNFNTTPGRLYVIEYKNSLEDSEWFQLSGYLLAETNRIEFEDIPVAQPQRFYRVVMLPAVSYRSATPGNDK